MRRKAASSWSFLGAALSCILASIVLGGALGGCHPKYPKCENDKDCKTREFCVQGMCQQCRNDKDCDDGKCNQGRCEQKSQMSQSCSDDAQCPAGQSCIDGACRACRSDGECGEGGRCNQGRCARAAEGAGDHNGGGGDRCRFEAVYFDFNENVLSTEATASIDHNAECIKRLPNLSVTLTGHTDPRGTEEYNLALSDCRAQAVRDRLQRIGANPASMRIVPKGELEATGTDESGWSRDRRVDFSN